RQEETAIHGFTNRWSFYSSRRRQAFVNVALLGGLVRLPQAVVDPRQVVAHIGLIRTKGGAALQLRGGLGKLALLLEQDAELVVALPLVSFQPNRGAQQLLRLRRIAAAREEALRIHELRQGVVRIAGGPGLEARQDRGEAVDQLVEHFAQEDI